MILKKQIKKSKTSSEKRIKIPYWVFLLAIPIIFAILMNIGSTDDSIPEYMTYESYSENDYDPTVERPVEEEPQQYVTDPITTFITQLFEIPMVYIILMIISVPIILGILRGMR